MPAPVPQYQYITVYDARTKQNGFDNNGLAVLRPSKCEVTEELNGAYSVTFEHPIDDVGIWRNIQVFNIVKVLGQLFTIINAEPNYTGKSGKITAYAEHVFYKQNDEWIPPKKENSGGDWDDVSISRVNVFYALSSARDESFPNERGEEYFPEFYFDSDVETNAEYAEKIDSGKTRCEEIFDLLSEYGGELYRNNFYYSINKRMETAQDNAFDIRIGLNLKGIRRTVDMSTFCTHFSAWDNYGNFFAVSYDDASLGNLPVPNIIARSKNFTYPEEYESIAMSLLERDAMAYFAENLAPKITYTVSVKDVRNNPDFKVFDNFRYKVGDTGRVYDERLGGELTLKIVRTKTDGITGEVTEITFGDVSGFIYEYTRIPVPEFPIAEPAYDEGKIAVIRLDENFEETDDITYHFTIPQAKNAMNEHPERLYHVHIGKDAGLTNLGISQSTTTFYSVANLYSISIPETITRIGQGVFRYCTSLKSIVIPDTVETLGDYVFYGCSSLESVTLSNRIPKLGVSAFNDCNLLKSIDIPDSVTIIEQSAFANTLLDSVTLPKRLEKIGSYVFRNTRLKDITIGSTVREIGSAFVECNSLSSITVKNVEESISGDPWGAPGFISTAYAKKYGNPDGKKTVQWGVREAFDGTRILLLELDENGRITRVDRNIDWDAVKYMLTEYSDITFDILMTNSAPVHTIPAECFKDMTNLRRIEIPSKFTEIGENAFSGCTNLESVEIDNHRGVLSGEPWGAPENTEIFYTAFLTTENGETLNQFSIVTTGYETAVNTGLSGILRVSQEEENPEEKLLYLIEEDKAFGLKLGTKEIEI